MSRGPSTSALLIVVQHCDTRWCPLAGAGTEFADLLWTIRLASGEFDARLVGRRQQFRDSRLPQHLPITTMTSALDKLPAQIAGSDLINAVVEIPQGRRVKYKHDPRNGCMRLSKILPQGAVFPFDFGFIPSTCVDDGDPLDVMILIDEATYPGCVVPCRLIGVIQALQTPSPASCKRQSESPSEPLRDRNDRLLAVPETKYNPPSYRTLDELPPQLIEEIEHFFISYNKMEGRRFEPIGRGGPEAAAGILKSAMIDR